MSRLHKFIEKLKEQMDSNPQDKQDLISATEMLTGTIVASILLDPPLQRAQRLIQTQPLNSNISYRQVFKSTINSKALFSLYKPFWVNLFANQYRTLPKNESQSFFFMNFIHMVLYFIESVGTIATIQTDTIKKGYIQIFQDLRAQKRVYRGFGASIMGYNLIQTLSYIQWDLFSSKDSKANDGMMYLICLTSFAAAYPFFSASRRMIADSINTELHYKNYKQLLNEVKLANLYKGWQVIIFQTFLQCLPQEVIEIE